MEGEAGSGGSWFQRFLLPGFALKAVIIGGGYATGRELAEYFVPAGPWGGLAGMLLATLIWSVVAALTFAGEAIGIGIEFHISPLRVLATAFDFDAGIRPGWEVLAAGLAVAVLDFVRARWNRRVARPRPVAAE